jgi:hypothetical protein
LLKNSSLAEADKNWRPVLAEAHGVESDAAMHNTSSMEKLDTRSKRRKNRHALARCDCLALCEHPAEGASRQPIEEEGGFAGRIGSEVEEPDDVIMRALVERRNLSLNGCSMSGTPEHLDSGRLVVRRRVAEIDVGSCARAEFANEPVSADGSESHSTMVA